MPAGNNWEKDKTSKMPRKRLTAVTYYLARVQPVTVLSCLCPVENRESSAKILDTWGLSIRYNSGTVFAPFGMERVRRISRCI